MVVVQNSVALRSKSKHTQPSIHPLSQSPGYNHSANMNNLPRQTGKIRTLLKNSLVEHLYNLFAAPIE